MCAWPLHQASCWKGRKTKKWSKVFATSFFWWRIEFTEDHDYENVAEGSHRTPNLVFPVHFWKSFCYADIPRHAYQHALLEYHIVLKSALYACIDHLNKQVCFVYMHLARKLPCNFSKLYQCQAPLFWNRLVWLPYKLCPFPVCTNVFFVFVSPDA